MASLKFRLTTLDVLLTGSGSPNPGGAITLSLFAPADGGLPYQVGSSLGTGPIPIGTRQIGLSPDPLLALSVGGLLPGVFAAYSGKLDPGGRATAKVNIPNDPLLKGIRIHSAFVTLDGGSPFGIKSISGTFTFTIL